MDMCSQRCPVLQSHIESLGECDEEISRLRGNQVEAEAYRAVQTSPDQLFEMVEIQRAPHVELVNNAVDVVMMGTELRISDLERIKRSHCRILSQLASTACRGPKIVDSPDGAEMWACGNQGDALQLDR